MKKNLFFLFAMLCSMSMFVACSDDDDPKEVTPNLPTEALTPESGNLTVSINGTAATTGSAQFEVQNASEAILTLTNVIPGYASVPVNVELEAQTDGSYKFAGEAGLTTPPSMTTRAYYVPVIMNVAVQGTVTADGKASVTATTALSEEAQGNLAGTWNLSLQYPCTQGEFDADTWETPRYDNPYPPIRLAWTAKDSEKLNGEQCGLILTRLCGNLLKEVVENISLSTNGNLTASYYPAPIFNQVYDWNSKQWTQSDPENAMTTWIMDALLNAPTTTEEEAPNIEIPVYSRNWLSSPTNLVYWYQKDGYLYIIPNITAILNQVSADQGTNIDTSDLDLQTILSQLTELGISTEQLMALIPTIQEWMTTGIPLKYEVTGDRLSLYVTKEMAAPFMDLLLPALPGLWEMVVAADPTGMAGMAIMLLGIQDISDLQTIWENNTDDFSITLNLKK